MKHPIDRVFLVVILLVGLTVPSRVRGRSAGPSAKELYRKAHSRWNRMEKNPEVYHDRDWRHLGQAFRSVYFRSPTSGFADDAVFFEGEVYRFLYERTNRIEDWNKAVSRYKFLMREYPYSSLDVRALLILAGLYKQRGLAEWTSFVQQCPQRYKSACRKVPMYRTLTRAIDREREKKVRSDLQWDAIRSRLEDIRAFPGKSYTRVVLYMNNPTTYRPAVLRKPDRLYIDLDATVLSDRLKKKVWSLPHSSYLQGVRTGQFLPDTARVVLDFHTIRMHRIFTLENPFRIVIDVFRKDWEPAPIQRTITARKTDPKTHKTLPEARKVKIEKPAPLPQSNRNGKFSIYRQLDLVAGRIMIDPGHGGRDPGAIGVGGVKEKDVTLEVARQLKQAIEKRWNVEVLMTRNSDRFVPLEERTAMANSKGVDLFLSIHANASRRGKARGIETYYLQWAKDEQAMEVAARENAVTAARMHELKKFIKMILQNPKMEESRDLASFVQKSVVQALSKPYGAKNLGVKTAPFYVLMGAQMPAVLVEISFLTHPKEGRLLKNPRYQRNIVHGLIAGLEKYLDSQGTLAKLGK